MTMFSAEKRRFCGGEGFAFIHGFSSVGSDLVGGMTTDDIDIDIDNEQRNDSLNDGAESSSKDEREREEEWLQLSIGNGGGRQDLGTSSTKNMNGSGSGLVELELMPSSTNNSSSTHRPEFRAPRPVGNFGPAFFYQHPTSTTSNCPPPHQEINWEFRPIPINLAAPSSSSASYFPRPFQIYDVAPPALDFRVIPPPRRPHSGVWFMLQASHNQEKEPFLPQISKSYLRIKDGRMTIRLVIKYLVNKLSLENESEIEIRCKGQRLLPFLTLQHVRDNIWSSPRDFITLLPNSSTTHHIMVLHYARTHPSN